MSAQYVEAARRAYADVAEARENIAAAQSKQAEYRLQRAREADDLVRLRDEEVGDAARRIMDGADSTPEKPRRRSRILKLEENAPALEAAILLQEQSIRASQDAVGPLLPPLKSPVTVRLVDGRPIDEAENLDATALPKGRQRRGGEAEGKTDVSGSGALYALACDLKRFGETVEAMREALNAPENSAAAAHVEKEEKVSKGRGDRAIQRAWNRAPDAVDDRDEFDDVPPIESIVPKRSSLRFLSPGECSDAPSRGYVVKGFLAPGDVGCIYGAPGAGKSLIAPHLGYAVAQGRSAFGMRTKAGRVFYVAAEDPHGMRGRVSALQLRHGDGDNFTLVEGVSDLLADGSPDLIALLDAVEEHTPSLIFVDTLAMAFPGLEENSAEQMGRVVAVARRLASHGAAVVLIHHDTKAGTPTPRGHSLLNGALDVALQLLARDEQGIVRGKMSKNRNGACDRDIAFRISTEAMGTDEDGDPISFALVEELHGTVARAKVKLTGSEQAALTILTDMIDLSAGRPVAEHEWREACINGRTVSASEERESRARMTRRAFKGLAGKRSVIFRDESALLPEIWPDATDYPGDDLDDDGDRTPDNLKCPARSS